LNFIGKLNHLIYCCDVELRVFYNFDQQPVDLFHPANLRQLERAANDFPQSPNLTSYYNLQPQCGISQGTVLPFFIH